MQRQRWKITFFGHGIPTLILNVGGSVLAPSYLYGVITDLQKGIQHSIVSIFFTFLQLLILVPFAFGSPAYLCFELKHVIRKDGIADNSIIGKIAFTLMSIVGYASSLLTIRTIGIKSLPYLHGEWVVIEVILLSFISSFGGALGLMDIIPTDILLRLKLLLRTSKKILTSRLILLVLLTTFLFSAGVGILNLFITSR